MSSEIIKSKSTINLNLEVIIGKEDNYYVVYCPALELSSYADTVEKAKISFKKEMEIFLEETFQRGTLEKYLLKNGWRLQQLPELNYEPPKQSKEKHSALTKTSGKVVHQQFSIPVYC